MKTYHAFGAVPASVLPSQPVRYWHHALLIALAIFVTVYACLLLALAYVMGPNPLDTLSLGLTTTAWVLTAGGDASREAITNYAQSAESPRLFIAGLGAGFVLSLALSLYVGWLVSKPKTRVFHVRGMQLKKGDDAKREARLVTQENDPSTSLFNVKLTDDLTLPKKILSKHILISGGVGSGKTVVLMNFIDAMVNHPTAKALIYDVKGDVTARFPQCPIIGVDDERGRSIPLGKVIQTKQQASIFMQSVIPDETHGNKFFNSTARLVGVGVIMTLINTHGDTWGAKELADLMNKQATVLAEHFKKHDQKAAQALGDPSSKTAMDIMATVASYTRIFDTLALAWSKYKYDRHGKILKNKDGSPCLRREWNPMEWITDGYKGPRSIILQGGGDRPITHGLISAIVNLLTPEIVSPKLKDNEDGRCIALILDEIPTIGKIADFETLAVAGRSKGISMFMVYQDIAQMKALYGPDMTTTIESTAFTHIVCQVQRGDTREHIAKSFSSRVVASISHADGKVHEEGKAVVYPDELTTDLGFRKGKQYGPAGWGINFLIQVGGYNPMILQMEGKAWPEKRKGRVMGAWTKPKPYVAPIELTEDDVEAALNAMPIPPYEEESTEEGGRSVELPDGRTISIRGGMRG